MAADEPSNLDEHINETICAITSAPEATYGQIQAVKSLVYHQKDTVLVAATGYGKSAVLYAVGALTKKMTIQIVPLSKLGRIVASQRDTADNPYNRVAAREVTEGLLTSFYELKRAVYTRLGAEEGRGFAGWWIGRLRD